MSKHDNINRDEIKNMSKESKEDLNADPITGEPGSHPIGTGIGGVGGAAAGAAIGSVAGPLGTLIGGAIGAIVGGSAGKAAAEAIDPTQEQVYWRAHYAKVPYYQEGYDFDRDYHPAYAVGYSNRHQYDVDARFEDHESDLRQSWEEVKGESRLAWEDAKHATRDAWYRVTPFDDSEFDTYWRENHTTTSYYNSDFDYDQDYRPAYRAGHSLRSRYPANSRFEDHESELKSSWEEFKANSRLTWEQAKLAVRDGWNRLTR